MMEKTKELTLKQRLQNLSEEQTPFFHSLTPFAAGFTQGFNYEKKRLVAALRITRKSQRTSSTSLSAYQ